MLFNNKEGVIISRKKKPTRKYIPRNEFRYNYSPSSAGHPDYVFGEKNGKLKSLGLTHNPKKEYKSSKLDKNPNPKDSSDSYLQHKVKTTNEKYFSDPLNDWKFSDDDMHLTRHLKKQYKKRLNKKRR